MRRPLRWLWLAVAVIVLDLATKYAASHFLSYAQPVEVLPFFNLTLLHNTGAAFSFLAEHPGWQRWFFCSHCYWCQHWPHRVAVAHSCR